MTTHYEAKVSNLINMPEHGIIEAVLGVAHELRTANFLALNRLLLEAMLHQDAGVLDAAGTEILTKVSTQVLERLELTAEPATR